jgi:hypothetical protein
MKQISLSRIQVSDLSATEGSRLDLTEQVSRNMLALDHFMLHCTGAELFVKLSVAPAKQTHIRPLGSAVAAIKTKFKTDETRL